MGMRLVLASLALAVTLVSGTVQQRACSAAQSAYEEVQASFTRHNYSTFRFVDPSRGNDSLQCLNGGETVPCRTVNFAATGNISTADVRNAASLEIVLLPGEHKLTDNLVLFDSEFVYLHGREAAGTLLTCANFPNDKLINGTARYDDLAFIDGGNVRIANLTFTRCGPISASIFFSRVTNITIEGCTFEGVLSSAVFGINVTNSFFINNKFLNNRAVRLDDSLEDVFRLRTVQDLQLFFNSRASSAGGVSLSLERDIANVLFLRNTFSGNRARPNFASSPAPMRLQPLGRGGAISLRIINSTSNNLCIKESTFTNNTAEVSAGAITYSVAGFTTDSSLTVDGCTFDGNTCELDQCIGGAMAFQTGRLNIDGATNYIFFLNSVVRNNRAGVAAGFSGFSGQSSQMYHFENCTFEGNVAESDSTAVSILSVGITTARGSTFNCTNCNFTSNLVAATGNNDVPAFYAHRSTCHFKGTTTFTDNVGGGMGISQGVTFTSGTLQFERNVAVHGGGLKLLNSPVFFVLPQTEIFFLNNHAVRVGGAIFAQQSRVTRFFLLNRDCFFQYYSPPLIDHPPDTWELLVRFQGNTAVISGSAVFSDDFEDCRFVGGDNSTGHGLPFPPNIFVPPDGVNSAFKYYHPNGSQIQSVSHIQSLVGSRPQSLNSTPAHDKVAIGEIISFYVVASDELLHNTSAVFATEGELDIQPLGTATKGGKTLSIPVHGTQVEAKLKHKCRNASSPTSSDGFCSESVNVTVGFHLQADLDIHSGSALSVAQCHPGYTFDTNDKACMCRNTELVDFVRCDRNHRYFYVTAGTWVAIARNGSMFVFRSVPTITLNCTQRSSLPGCLVEFDHLEQQCAEGRIGPMCAACNASAGYGITMDLTRCTRKCSDGGAVLFVLICVATIVGCVVVLYFNIGIPNELRGFFLFAQVIGSVYAFSNFLDSTELGTDFVDVVANLLGTSLPFPVCISPDITTTWMTVLGYVPPALAFITVLVFVISARYISRLAKRSTLGGISLILLFIYKYITDVSLLLFNCVEVPTEDGTSVWIGRRTGELCAEFPYVLLVVLALVLFLVAIIPIPVFVMVITKKKFRRMKQFSDILSKGFVPAQAWYSGWDLLRRLCFVLIALWVPSVPVPVRLLMLLLFEIVMLVVLCLSKPYEKKWINIVEALILLDLFVATAAILQPRDAYTGKELSVVLVLLPFLYALPVGVGLLGQAVWSKYISEQHKEWVRTAAGHFFAIVCHKTTNTAGLPPPPPETQFSHADSLESPLLAPSDSLGSHDNTDREDVTTYREELLFSESMIN